MKRAVIFNHCLAMTLLLFSGVGCPATDDEGEPGRSDQRDAEGDGSVVPEGNPSDDPVMSDTGEDEADQQGDLTEDVPFDFSDTGTSDSSQGSCNRDGFQVARENAYQESFGIQYVAIDSAGMPYDALLVQIYRDYDGPTSPGTYSLDGINFAECGLCLLAFTDCEDNGCDKTFYAQQGSVEITALGGIGDQFAATLSGVVFDEVTIDDQTFVSTPVVGGETWCVDGLSYDQEILDPNVAMCEREDVTCVGEAVADFSLQNCATGEMVSIYSLAEGRKALWFVLTAGWCPACHEYLPTVIEYDDANATRGLEVIYVLGENGSYRQPSLTYCQQYAERYSTEASRFYIDHDGQYSFATTYTYLWPYVDSNGAIGLPWNGVVDAVSKEYSYADGAGAGTLAATLEALLSD